MGAWLRRVENHLSQENYTPQWAESVTGIPAFKIRQIAEDYARAKPAAIFCNAGISHQLNAFDTYRTLAFLAARQHWGERWRMQFHAQHLAWALNLPALKSNLPKKDSFASGT